VTAADETGPLSELPLFPLGTVLFPGGVLPLRVFEARYVDMIRRVMREAGDFGVVLIQKGQEVVERDVEIEDVGCRARIVDWNMEQLGVLQISTVGTTRFRIVSRDVKPDGLIVAQVEPLELEAAVPVPDECQACRSLLKRIVDRLDEAPREAEDAAPPPIAKPYLFDDATWVGNRLAEVLPIPRGAKHKLMALTDAPARLSIIKQYLAEHGIA
jgi:Lon protease-like protein